MSEHETHECRHVIYDIGPNLSQVIGQFFNVEHKIDQILRRLHDMPTTDDLNAAVQAVKDASNAGMAAIDTAIQAAADRVIATLSVPGVDPTQAIADLNALKDASAASTQAEVDKLNAIDPAAPTPEPTPVP
jgi:DNA-binding NarL/FixJ family response regulator